MNSSSSASKICISNSHLILLGTIIPLDGHLARSLAIISSYFLIPIPLALYEQIALGLLTAYWLISDWTASFKAKRRPILLLSLLLMILCHFIVEQQGGSSLNQGAGSWGLLLKGFAEWNFQNIDLRAAAFLSTVLTPALLAHYAGRNHRTEMRSIYIDKNHRRTNPHFQQLSSSNLSIVGITARLLATSLFQVTLLILSLSQLSLPLETKMVVPLFLQSGTLILFLLLLPSRPLAWQLLSLGNATCLFALFFQLPIPSWLALLSLFYTGQPWLLLLPPNLGEEKKLFIGYDGDCSLCNHFILFLVDNTPHPTGAERISFYSQPLAAPDTSLQSLIVEERGAHSSVSNTRLIGIKALLLLLKHFGGVLSVANSLVSLLPDTAQNAFYQMIARNRYHLWGSASSATRCHLLLFNPAPFSDQKSP
jgi:predicted DCC family thiol-disulfide oxidoreductase YuxK